MRSMTGYAYVEESTDEVTVSVEIKSYNSRFLDLSVNQPYWLSRLESRIREYAQARVLRGKAELTVRIREKRAGVAVVADTVLARAWRDAASEVSRSLGLGGEVPLSMVVAQEGVLRAERDLDVDAYWARLEPVLARAFADFDVARDREGSALRADIEAMLSRIEDAVGLVGEWAPRMEELFREGVRARFAEVLGDQVDEQRVLQETAALIVRYTINEELVRLRAHIGSLKDEIRSNPAPGRKIDFICQEINREINTIGSKNQILEVGRAVIDVKDALENIREQVRNVE